jgi:AraC family transcriptional regulator
VDAEEGLGLEGTQAAEKSMLALGSSTCLVPDEWMKRQPYSPLLSSGELRWGHLHAYRLKNPSRYQLQLPAATHHNIIAHLANAGVMATRWGGVTRRSASCPGNISIMSAFQESQWEWTGEICELHIFLDPQVVVAAAGDVTDKSFQLIDGIALVDSVLAEIALSLNTELERPGLCTQLFASSMAQLLALNLLRQHSTLSMRSVVERLDMPRHKLRNALEFIDAHISNDITLESIASAVCMSPFRFARGFKKTTGRSPHRYIVWRRIERAKELLRTTDTRIADIARQTGFLSHSHFTAVFTQKCRLTPKKFRAVTKE